MKNLIVIMVFALSISVFAQDGRKDRKERSMSKATPEEMADLHTKRLTLALVLNDRQQKEVYELEVVEAKRRMAARDARKDAKDSNEKPSRENMKQMRLKMLDNQIAHQEKMQDILDDEQFKLWRKLRAQKMKLFKEGRGDQRRARPYK